jgi:hypothetical protein
MTNKFVHGLSRIFTVIAFRIDKCGAVGTGKVRLQGILSQQQGMYICCETLQIKRWLLAAGRIYWETLSEKYRTL